ncbi:MAG: putative regulator of cell autolysis, partial [Bacteroidetes bacterium]|nr:putative regulator of cell autolysis [Bacteroidota bacterium]
MNNTRLNWRIVFIIVFIAMMLFALGKMYSSGSESVDNGKLDLTSVDFKQNELVALNGHWEFYWDKLLTSKDFIAKQPPPIDSLMKVPGTWDDRKAGTKVYPHRGVATYRLRLNYPSTLKDPALRIQNVATAYKLYANGRLIEEVGKVSDKPSDFKDGEESLILDLPKDTQELELIFQVANLNYARGGLREGPVFGSKQVLERQKMILFALQLFFIGSVFIFSIYYFLLFLLQTKNKTALLFSMLCFNTALRSLIWGEAPLVIFFPNVSFDVRIYINYLTGYNLVPIMILFVLSIYPLEYKKTILGLVLLPTLFFDVLLLTPPQFMSSFTNYLYVLILLQMIYIMGVLIKVVLHKRDNAILMFIAIYVF